MQALTGFSGVASRTRFGLLFGRSRSLQSIRAELHNTAEIQRRVALDGRQLGRVRSQKLEKVVLELAQGDQAMTGRIPTADARVSVQIPDVEQLVVEGLSTR